MKSQLVTALTVVGVLGTATTAMAANTDVLALLDSPDIASATDALLPDPNATTDPATVSDPSATPAPTDPSATPAPAPVDPDGSVPVQQQAGTTQHNSGSAPAPAVQPVAAVVNGTTGGSGSRVAPAAGVVTSEHDDDHDEDYDEDHDEHEDGDDD